MEANKLIRTETEPDNFLIRANDNIPMNEAILNQGETRVMSLGDISVITGQPKSRKTFLVTAICSAFLSKDGYLGLKPITKGKLLLIDTEQSKPFVLSVIKRIFRILKWDYNENHDDEISVMTLRELTANERLLAIEKAIIKFSPKFVVIDGFADLLEDTNSLEESTKKVSLLMRLSSEHSCHICSVVHTNPNSEKMRGHTGSELQRKGETVMLVTKSEEVTTVSPQFCRNLEFSKFSFRIDANGLPIACDYTPSPEDNTRILFESIFLVSPNYNYTDLKKEVMRKLSIKNTAAENRIKKGLEAGIIVKDSSSVYSLKQDDEDNSRPF
jgi:hypothetical protein